MILALDVGNSQIFGGVFEDGALTIRFRKPSQGPTSSVVRYTSSEKRTPRCASSSRIAG